MEYLITLLIAFAAGLVLIPLFARAAIRYGLVDKPDVRKRHEGAVPIVGGVAIYVSMLLTAVLIGFNPSSQLPLLLGVIIICFGLIDDRVQLSSGLRLVLQAVCAIGMVYLAGNSIESVGNLVGTGPVVLSGFFAAAFTVMCTIGVINAINMIDGVDGLSGTVIAISLATIGAYAHIAGDTDAVHLILSGVGAVLAFLWFNSRLARARAAVFMGDAGSMFFGFFLVWYYIKLTQGEGAVLSPVSAGWIFGVPLLECVSVMVGRVREGRSPFQAGRDHLHYRLLDAGFSVNKTVLIIALVHACFVVVGIANNEYRALEPYVFWLFVGLVVAHHFFTPRLILAFAAGHDTGELSVTEPEPRLVERSSGGVILPDTRGKKSESVTDQSRKADRTSEEA